MGSMIHARWAFLGVLHSMLSIPTILPKTKSNKSTLNNTSIQEACFWAILPSDGVFTSRNLQSP